MPVNRVHLLVFQLRDKVRNAAVLQRRIYADIDLVLEARNDLRAKFQEARGEYLNLLHLTVPELRALITQSDVSIPTDIFHVEDIMKRVLPVTERYLQRLVSDGIITETDMDCILIGGYAYIEDFFRDMEKTGGTLSPPKSIESSEDDLQTPEQNTTQGDDEDEYDEDGFFVVGKKEVIVADTDDAEETSNDTTAQAEPNPTTPPALFLQPNEPFSWADDVENELALLEPPKQSDQDDQPSLQTEAPPMEEDRSPVDTSFLSNSSDSISDSISDSSSDTSSEFDFDVTQMELLAVSNISEPPHSDPELEKEEEEAVEAQQKVEEHTEHTEEKTDVKIEVDAEEKTGDQKDDAQPAEPGSDTSIVDHESSDLDMPELCSSEADQGPIPPDFPTYYSLIEKSNGDDILDEWLMDNEMWYWQYELLFLVTLAAKQYQHIFEEARGVYKADPFADD
ncbi:hypothetical protein F4806DRAFT_114846 [Annulohypoxylon nitens]|nr:hypothetical protein F4806DRAFT_114846 [Annulohypoxylon nitens]